MKYINNAFILYIFLLLGACAKGSGAANNDQIEDENFFVKNVLIMEFVSFDCVYCPKVHRQLQDASSRRYPNRIDVVSVHGRLEEADPMEFKGYRQFQNYFYAITGYPAVILDQRDDLVTIGSFDVEGISFLSRIQERTNVGIALHPILSESNNAVSINVKVANKGDLKNDYRLVVAVLENGIVYRQAELVDGSLRWIEDYKHDNVLRAILSENYFGDLIGDLKENGTYSKTLVYNIPTGYKAENLSFVAYLLEAKGFSQRQVINSKSAKIGENATF